MVVLDGNNPRRFETGRQIGQWQSSILHGQFLLSLKPRGNSLYLMMLEASSASGSAQYLLARIKQASADSIYVQRTEDTDMLPESYINQLLPVN